MRIRTWLVGLATLGLVASGTTASAETVRRTDPRGDAPAGIDLTRVSYTHETQRLKVVAVLPRLGDAGVATLSLSRFEVFEAGYVVEIRKRAGHEPRTRLLFFDHFDTEPRACDDVAGTWGDRRVTLSVARSCLTGQARPRMLAEFTIQRGAEADHAPAVTRLRRS